MRVATRLAFQAGTVWALGLVPQQRETVVQVERIGEQWRSRRGRAPSATASGSGVNAATAGVPAPPRVSGAVSTDGSAGPDGVSHASSAGWAIAHW